MYTVIKNCISDKMDGYLHQIVQCALSKALSDKLSYAEDVYLNADVSIIVDRTENFRFFVTDRLVKANIQYYEEQFRLLFGSPLQRSEATSDVGALAVEGSRKDLMDAITQTHATVNWSEGALASLAQGEGKY